MKPLCFFNTSLSLRLLYVLLPWVVVSQTPQESYEVDEFLEELYTGLAHIDYTNQYHDIDTKQLGVAAQTTLNIYLTKTFALNLTGGLTLSNKHSNRYWGATLRWNAKRFKYFQS